MISYLRSNLQFILLVLLWFIVGRFSWPVAVAFIPLTVIIMKARGYYSELFLGFITILLFSDNRHAAFEFAGKVKDVYLSLLILFLFFDSTLMRMEFKLILRFLPFFAIALFCLFYSTIFFTSLQKLMSYVFLVIVVPAYAQKAFQTDGKRFFQKLVWLLTLMLIVGLGLRYVSPEFVTLEGRFNGLLGNPNSVGLFCVMLAIFAVISGEIDSKLFSRIDRIIIFLVLGYALWICGSRNALLTLGIFFFFRTFYRISPFVGFVIFLLVLIGYQIIESNFESIIFSLGLQDYFRVDTLQSGSGRLVAWQFGWEWIQKSPVLGNGIGFTEDLYHRYYNYLSMLGHQGNAHNSYITLWLDTGILGLVCYLGAVLYSFIRCASNTRSAIPVMYTILFHAFFESWLAGSLNPFTSQMLLAITIMSIPAEWFTRREEAEKEAEAQAIDAAAEVIGPAPPPARTL